MLGKTFDMTTSRTYFQGSFENADLKTTEQSVRKSGTTRVIKTRGSTTAGQSSLNTSFKGGRNIATAMSIGNANVVPKSRCGFMDEDPGALKINQSQNKFWYKVRVKSS